MGIRKFGSQDVIVAVQSWDNFCLVIPSDRPPAIHTVDACFALNVINNGQFSFFAFIRAAQTSLSILELGNRDMEAGWPYKSGDGPAIFGSALVDEPLSFDRPAWNSQQHTPPLYLPTMASKSRYVDM